MYIIFNAFEFDCSSVELFDLGGWGIQNKTNKQKHLIAKEVNSGVM
jgi:hypothetical protein